MSCIYIRQSEQLGLGHAVLCAKPVVNDEPFAVILADDLIDGDPPAMKQMVDVFAREGRSVLGVQEVARDQTASYGIVKTTRVDERLESVEAIVEKPRPEAAPSNLAVVGRYVLTPRILSILERVTPGAGGEIQLTDAIAVAAEGGARSRVPVPRHALRLRIEARLPAGDRRVRAQARGSGAGVRRMARSRERMIYTARRRSPSRSLAC